MEKNSKKFKSKADLSRAKTFLKQGGSCSSSLTLPQPQPPAKKEKSRGTHRSNGNNRSSTLSKATTDQKTFITLNEPAIDEDNGQDLTTERISSRTEFDEEDKQEEDKQEEEEEEEEEDKVSDHDTAIKQLLEDVTSQNDKNKGRYGNMYGSMQHKEAQLKAMDTTIKKLNKELNDLESLCEQDEMNEDQLEDLYQSIPEELRPEHLEIQEEIHIMNEL